MIRYHYINRLVLELYSNMPFIQFPINPIDLIHRIPNCRYMSYQDFMKLNNCTLDDVIILCESSSGCTHYDVKTNRYLILCNESLSNNNNTGRQRWTCSHEIGHIICNHHSISLISKLSENSFLKIENEDFEKEADYFAATILAPFPLFGTLGISAPQDVQNTFGLSREAAINRFEQYLKWKSNHRKTSWENDILKLYIRKKCEIPLPF